MGELTGKVTTGDFGVGSKSERQAVYLETPTGRYVLRRLGGNAFNDPAVSALVGKTIAASGEVRGYTFLMRDWSVVAAER